MEVKVAETAGFCFGVKRAVDKVYEQIEKEADTGSPIYTYGPIIHNEEVVKDLTERGVKVIESRSELEKLSGGTVVIRSHGVGRDIYEILERRGINMIDATCPFVLKIHNIVRDESAQGKAIIIIGNENHPEVQGIIGWSNTPTVVVKTPEEVEKITFPEKTPVCIVSQTTFNYKKFQVTVEKILEKSYDSSVVNTICNATHKRQSEARDLASQVDVMLVVGGKNSSNTQKLYEICQNECKHTYYIQTPEDLDARWFDSMRSVGITAGASTPNNIIEEVHTNVRIKF